MSGHTIFYYPYASFGHEQASFLRAEALYFDSSIFSILTKRVVVELAL
jgi:hypothetical protein